MFSWSRPVFGNFSPDAEELIQQDFAPSGGRLELVGVGLNDEQVGLCSTHDLCANNDLAFDCVSTCLHQT